MILTERPADGGAYGWCPKCVGFVIELGRHCFNDDSHIVDHLSPQEREELKTDEKPDVSKKKPPEPIKKPEIKEESKPMLTPEQQTQAQINGAKIKKYRERCGLGRDRFARVIGISGGTLLYWEDGRSYPADSERKNSKRKIYNKLMNIIDQESENEEWESFWSDSKKRVTVKEPQVKMPVSNQPEKKVDFQGVFTEFIRGIVREEIQKAFRDLADRSS